MPCRCTVNDLSMNQRRAQVTGPSAVFSNLSESSRLIV